MCVARGTAIVRASSRTDVKIIQATIKALQQNGIEKFALRSHADAIVPSKTAPSLSVTFVNDEAEVLTSNDVPYKHVISVISILVENGVRKVRFAPAQKSGPPAAKTKKANKQFED